MVCVICSLDAAAIDIIEICADTNFSEGLNFYSTGDYASQWHKGVKWDKVSINSLSQHTYTVGCPVFC